MGLPAVIEAVDRKPLEKLPATLQDVLQALTRSVFPKRRGRARKDGALDITSECKRPVLSE
jgi:hypothetical protein